MSTPTQSPLLTLCDARARMFWGNAADPGRFSLLSATGYVATEYAAGGTVWGLTAKGSRVLATAGGIVRTLATAERFALDMRRSAARRAA
jgi:hypothetical protein